LTTVKTEDGAEEVYREAGQRYVAIKYSVRGRDLGSTVEEAIRKVNAQVALPIGYKIDWAGEYASQQRSTRRLMIVLPITLIVIFVLLYMMFHSASGPCSSSSPSPWRRSADSPRCSSPAPLQRLLRRRIPRPLRRLRRGRLIMLEYINQMRVRGHSIEEAASRAQSSASVPS